VVVAGEASNHMMVGGISRTVSMPLAIGLDIGVPPRFSPREVRREVGGFLWKRDSRRGLL